MFRRDAFGEMLHLSLFLPDMPFRSRTFLLRAALIAMVAMMASAIMPAASQLARASAYGKTLALGEICSVSLSKSEDPAKRLPLSDLAACAYCTLHADHPAVLPTVADAGLSLPAERDTYPSLFYQAPYRFAVWARAVPRGPPAFS
jgi:hypothetical protein